MPATTLMAQNRVVAGIPSRDKLYKEMSFLNGKELIDRLINKSQEAFVMSIEIYNKPTIEYRVEGFAFFICNAWELLLKGQMIDKYGNDSIYYKDHPTRTLSLEKCVEKVFTNKRIRCV